MASTAAFSAVLWLISARYAPSFAGRQRVVMNWSFTGKPNSYASPRTALTVTPAVGTITLLLIGGAVAFATPHDERVGALLAIVFAVAAAQSALDRLFRRPCAVGVSPLTIPAEVHVDAVDRKRAPLLKQV